MPSSAIHWQQRQVIDLHFKEHIMEEFFFEVTPNYKNDITVTIKGEKNNKDFQELKNLLEFTTVKDMIKDLKENRKCIIY